MERQIGTTIEQFNQIPGDPVFCLKVKFLKINV